ncbi:hypothetical protein [Shewanella sp. KT0246]|uniref:hypothetical protein n=1 Tax=Shewanella sp. KT0246 TaxID=2815912 RepID=UPI001BC7AAA4|nr:hypothetical protein [Shewanella sp. KT0246]GIU53524.1 hypothetical protein TUM4249_31650 [Shewanella sp. KT0246]
MKNLLFILILFPCLSFAGSFIPLLDDFEPTYEVEIKAVKPNFVVDSIRRGTDDGNYASTSDAGIITFRLTNLPKQVQGYIFEIVEGDFEDRLFIGNPVTPSKYVKDKSEFTFIWLDGSSEEQEAFKVKVKITAVSISGNKSESQYLTVSHAGVQKPWWKFW